VLVEKLHKDKELDDNTYRWAKINPDEARIHQFYLLPKIHKTLTNPPGRPIVSGVQGPTEKLSKLVDHWLQPSVQRLPSYIRDSTDMLRTLQDWNIKYGPFPPHTQLVTIDVVGLYSNIPHNELLTAIEFSLDNFTSRSEKCQSPPSQIVLEIADHILKNNVFAFDQNIYRQTFGTAMGTPMAPSAANLFMGWLEQRLLSESPVPVSTDFWRRFIDDIFLLWLAPDEELQSFFNYLNTAHPTIKFTMTSSTDSVPFLDISISLKHGFLETDLYCKPTDAHAYLPSTSCHPRHVITNMPFGQFLRLKRLCSKDSVYKERCKELTTRLARRGHHRATIQKACDKASTISRTEALRYKTKQTTDRVPIVVGHNPANPPLRQWFSELHSKTISTSSRAQKAIPHPPLLGERNTRNLKSFLMPTQLPKTDEETAAGCFSCGKQRCVICKDHLVQATSFTSDTTGITYQHKQHLTCTTHNIIYLLFCNICKQAQYIGETEHALKTRFYTHRSHIKTNSGTCRLVKEHFNRPNHSLRNMRCMPIERVQSVRAVDRKRREDYWRLTMRTTAPEGLNSSNN
jgi:hypothetical protein